MGVIPIGKKVISSIEYFAIQTEWKFLIIKRVTTGSNYAISYLYLNKEQFTTAWANPNLEIYLDYNEAATGLDLLLILMNFGSGGGGGGTADSTAANQVLEIAELTAINTNTDNLDVPLSTRLKPADTLNKVSTVDTITNPVNTYGIGTKFVFSTVNASVAQLAAAATFTGVIESVVDQQSYSILFFSDQNATITIKQYIDLAGTKLVQQLSFSYIANSQFARSGVMNGNYCNVIVQNTGGSLTTKLQLDTAYGTIPSATQLNNSPISINEVNGNALNLGQTSKINSIPVTLSDENVQDLYIAGATTTTITNNILNAVVGTAALDVRGYRSGSVQVICPAGTYTTGAMIFEGSNDNVNFVAFPVWNQLLTTGVPIVAAITLATATFITYTFPIKFRYIRARLSTGITGASASATAFSMFSQVSWIPTTTQVANNTAGSLLTTATVASTTLTAATPGVAAANLGKAEDAVAATGDTGVATWRVRRDVQTISSNATGDYNESACDEFGNTMVREYLTQRRTYSCAFSVVVGTTATDVVEIIGSASTSVQITRLVIGGIATAVEGKVVQILRRSTAATGGTATNPAIVPYQATDAAATAVVKAYTANPTTGTLVGAVKNARILLGTVLAPLEARNMIFGERGKPLILAGVAQTLCINLGGLTPAGCTLDIEIEFTEI